MLDSIYVGLTGLSTFSKGLNVLSNNVANLNTPGFKRSQALFQDLLYNQDQLGDGGSQSRNNPSLGNGVDISGSQVIFKQGELRQTGNDLDAAISGNGFFILRKGDKTYYTRTGQFQFDKDGFLTSTNIDARVAISNGGSQIQDLNISTYRTNPPSISTKISLVGNLSSNDSDKKQELTNVNVYDSTGNATPLKITLTDNTAVTTGSWLIAITDRTGAAVASGEIRFQGNGSPVSGYEKFNFSYSPAGAATLNLTLDFGLAGSFSGVTNFSGGTDSTAKVDKVDGYAVGSLTKVTYDNDGQITAAYSNGQTQKLGKLALAWFNFLPDLDQEGGNIFVNDTSHQPTVGTAKTSVFGSITGGSIESSNVDLTQQFSELIITQRGYQASSQVISTANEMVQQLFDLKGKR